MLSGNVLGNRLKNIPADVIFCVRGRYFFFWGGGGRLKTKFSSEVNHRL